jgi:hypothetical protein
MAKSNPLEAFDDDSASVWILNKKLYGPIYLFVKHAYIHQIALDGLNTVMLLSCRVVG